MRAKKCVLALMAVVAPSLAGAQTQTQPAQAQAAAQPQQQPAQPAQPAQGQPSATGSAAPASSGPVTGYGYGDGKKSSGAPQPRLHVRAGAPVATLPGFEQLGDGSSRFFVELNAQVTIEERRAQGSVTYVLKGAQITHRNNGNALVTVHFNTPVSRARLVPSGADLLFVMDLRAANVAPTYKITAKGQGAIFTVDFPKGDYLPRDSQTDAPQQN